MRYTVTDGVAFFEEDVPSAQLIQAISLETDSMFRQTQLESVESIRKAMARKVIELGGNCVVGFEFGQKQTSFLRSLLSLDDVYWYGKGIAALVDPDTVD